MSVNFRRIVYLTLAEYELLRARYAAAFVPHATIAAAFTGVVDRGIDYYIREDDRAEHAARKRTT